MAAIDKTYISEWEVFDKVRNWAKDKIIELKNGDKISLINYMYYPYLTKEDWDNMEQLYKAKYPDGEFDVVLWNTPHYVDVWLIKNCPFQEIQDALKEQYGGGWSKLAFTNHNDQDMYEQIKNGTSIYDTYQRNGLGKKSKVKFFGFTGKWFRDNECIWWISVNPYWIKGRSPNLPTYWYNEDKDYWSVDEELLPITSNYAHRRGTLTKKNVVNLVKKWNFPKGTIVHFECDYHGYIMFNFYVKIT